MNDVLSEIIIAVGSGAISGIIIVAMMYNDVAWVKKGLADLKDRVDHIQGVK